MKPLALPTLWYSSAACAFVGVLSLAHKLAMNAYLTLALAWAGSILAALLVGGLALRIKPDLRFSTPVREDGLGYVHQTMDVVIHITMAAVLALGVFLLSK